MSGRILLLAKKIIVINARKILCKITGINIDNYSYVFSGKYLKQCDWISIGKCSYHNGARAFRWNSKDTLEIGKFCSIAHGVQFLCGTGNHDLDRVTTFPLYREFAQNISSYNSKKISDDPDKSKGGIIVKNDVWIGANVIVTSGVTINSGCVILPGSVVNKSLPPYSVVGGVPGRVVKFRFSEEKINKILNISWWDWADDKILKNIDDLYSDIDQFIDKHNI